MESYLDIIKDFRWSMNMRNIAKYGMEGKNPICENCGKKVDTREFAHLGKTGQKSKLKGMGRGLYRRILDFVKNYNDYGLFCHKCHKAYDDLGRILGDTDYQRYKDEYKFPHPDKQVRNLMHDLKIKRESKLQPNKLEDINTGQKVYLNREQSPPAGSQEERGPKGGRFYRKEQGAEVMDIIGDPEDIETFDPEKYAHKVKEFDMEDLNNMEKNFYKSKEFKQADPFNVAFLKKSIKIDDPPAEMGIGGQAIDYIVRGPTNHNYDGIVKAAPESKGRKVYVEAGKAAPPGVTLYRGGHGGRFFFAGEQDDTGYQDKKGKAKEIADKVRTLTDKVEKELNNLGNVGKLREVGIDKPDLPQNQGVLKGTNLAVEYTKKPDSPKFDLPQQPIKDKPQSSTYAKGTDSLIKGVLKIMLKNLNSRIEKQNMPSLNPTANPMTGVGNKVKAQGIKNKLQAGFKPEPSIPKVAPSKNMEAPKIQSPSMRSRGPRNIPFAQFSLVDRINKMVDKIEKGKFTQNIPYEGGKPYPDESDPYASFGPKRARRYGQKNRESWEEPLKTAKPLPSNWGQFKKPK